MNIIDCIQGSEEWYAARSGLVTASNIADVTAKGRGGSPSKDRKNYMFRLVAEKLTGLPQESYSNNAMAWGTETEQAAREYYEVLNGVDVQQVGFIERAGGDMGCSPDGLVGSLGMIQVKCPYSTTHIKYILADKMPSEYFKQVQFELFIAEREWSDFLSYDPRVTRRPSFIKRVYRDEKTIKKLHIGAVMFIDELKEMIDSLTEKPY